MNIHRINAVLRVKVCLPEAFQLKKSFFSAAAQFGPRPLPLTFLYHAQLDTHTHTHTHTPVRTSLIEWSARRKGRCRHNTQQTNSHSGIRTRDLSHRAAVNLRLTPRGHRVLQMRRYVMEVTVKITWLYQKKFAEEEGCLNWVRSGSSCLLMWALCKGRVGELSGDGTIALLSYHKQLEWRQAFAFHADSRWSIRLTDELTNYFMATI